MVMDEYKIRSEKREILKAIELTNENIAKCVKEIEEDKGRLVILQAELKIYDRVLGDGQ